MLFIKLAADLPPDAQRAIRTARHAGPRRIVRPDVGSEALGCLADAGLTRRFLGHVALTATGLAVLAMLAPIGDPMYQALPASSSR